MPRIESGAYNRPRLIASDACTGNRLVAAIILTKWIFSRSPVKGTKFIWPVIIDLDCT